MSNYANDNGTGLEQQVMIARELPERFLVPKRANENLPFCSHWKCNRESEKKSNMAALIAKSLNTAKKCCFRADMHETLF